MSQSVRRTLSSIVIALATVMSPALAASAPGALMPAPIGERPAGFGQATTGGCTDRQPSCICVVTSLDDQYPRGQPGTLRDCLARHQPTWVIFAARGTIALEHLLPVASDTTVDGRPLNAGDKPVTVTAPGSALFYVANVRNVIITDVFMAMGADPRQRAKIPPRCIKPERPADALRCGTPVLIKGDAHDIWLNHNSFSHCGDICIAIGTQIKDLPPGVRAPAGDRITISHNRIEKSFYGVLVQAQAALPDNQLPLHERVTLYNNLFDDIFRRSPRAASGATVHVFNNVIKNWGSDRYAPNERWCGWGPSAVGSAELLLENNVLIPRSSKGTCMLATENAEYKLGDVDRGFGRIKARGNAAEHGAEIREHDPAKVFDPSDKSRPDTFYHYDLQDTAGLEKRLEADAGPRGFGGLRPAR